MKVAAALLVLLPMGMASPVILWNKSSSPSCTHSSAPIESSSLLSKTLEGNDPSSSSVLFVVNRNEDGKEALTNLASAGHLPLISELMSQASSVHYHASGVENARSVTKDAKAENSVSLNEFLQKDDHSGNVVVTVDPKDAENLDSTVANAVRSLKYSNVMLIAQRSTAEIRQNRVYLENKRRAAMNAPTQRRRRLEEEGDDDQGDDAYEPDYSVYYVSMTPNMFSGILYMLMFTYVSFLGFSCMGQIQSQDVYVNKMPAIGREA